MVERFARLTHPFPVVVLDDLIPNVPELMATWPHSLIRHFDYPGGIKNNFNQEHPEWKPFMGMRPEWQAFVDTMIPNLLGHAEMHFGDRIKTSFAKMEFSELPNGGGLLPHPDTRRKVMTAIVYFTPDVWHPSWGGEFEICRHRTDPYGDFTDRQVPWSEVETVMAVPYRRGRVSIFRRRGNSLHGVRPIRCPHGITRNSLTINWILE